MVTDGSTSDTSSTLKGVKIGVIVVALLAAAYFAWSSGPDEGQVDTPESAAPYYCLECNKPFTLTPAGYQRLSESGGVKTVASEESRRGQSRLRCPHCNKFGGVPALVCPKDNTSFPNISVGGQPNKCPKCGWMP